MIEYSSTETFQSTTRPGATFTLRKWSVKRRREYNAAMADPLNRHRLVQDEISDLVAEEEQAQERANLLPCECKHEEHEGPCKVEGCACRHGKLDRKQYSRFQALLIERAQIETGEMQPIRLRWAVAAIDGIIVDGVPLTVEGLIENGPDDLTQEISAKIESMLFVDPAQAKNSSSPITSPAPGDGATSVTGADPASS